MPYALATVDGALLAAMADGRILHSGDRGETWGPFPRWLGALALR